MIDEPQIIKSNNLNIKKSLPIFVLGIILILLFSFYLLFPNLWSGIKDFTTSLFSKETSMSSEEQVKQGSALLSNSQVNFSKVLKITPLTEEAVSADFKEFILPNAVEKTFNKVEYEKGKIGTFSTYVIKNTEIRTVMMELNQTIKKWLKLNSSYASEFGFIEFTSNVDNSQARILIFKNGNDVKFNIKTESK